jgi:hypothetical protein
VSLPRRLPGLIPLALQPKRRLMRPLTRRPRQSPRGGEENPGPLGDWLLTGTTPPTQDATHLYFNGASADASAFLDVVGLKDNTSYEVIWQLIGVVAGSAKMVVYGATVAHGGSTPTHNASGTYTDTVTTNETGATFANQLRVKCGSASNTFTVVFVSVREILSVPVAGDFLIDENGDFLVDENTDFLVA